MPTSQFIPSQLTDLSDVNGSLVAGVLYYDEAQFITTQVTSSDNSILVSYNGASLNYRLPQKLGQDSSPSFNSISLSGTVPMSILGTGLVTNLNADLLDGKHSNDFQLSNSKLNQLASIVSSGLIVYNGTTMIGGVEVRGTSNQVNVSGGLGTNGVIQIYLPQNISADADVSFNSINVVNAEAHSLSTTNLYVNGAVEGISTLNLVGLSLGYDIYINTNNRFLYGKTIGGNTITMIGVNNSNEGVLFSSLSNLNALRIGSVNGINIDGSNRVGIGSVSQVGKLNILGASGSIACIIHQQSTSNTDAFQVRRSNVPVARITMSGAVIGHGIVLSGAVPSFSILSTGIMGRASLNSGICYVPHSLVRDTHTIMLTPHGYSSNAGSVYISGIVNNSGFTIGSTSLSDNRSIAWLWIRNEYNERY